MAVDDVVTRMCILCPQDIAAYRAKGGMGGGVKRGPGRPAVAGMAGRQAEPQDDDDEDEDDEEDDEDDDDDDDE